VLCQSELHQQSLASTRSQHVCVENQSLGPPIARRRCWFSRAIEPRFCGPICFKAGAVPSCWNPACGAITCIWSPKEAVHS